LLKINANIKIGGQLRVAHKGDLGSKECYHSSIHWAVVYSDELAAMLFWLKDGWHGSAKVLQAGKEAVTNPLSQYHLGAEYALNWCEAAYYMAAKVFQADNETATN
jgi:hypothetical protein